MRTILCRVALLIGVTPAAVWGQGPAGGEFAVNTYTTGSQSAPAVAVDAHGDFMAVWSTAGAIAARSFSAAGMARGDEVVVASADSPAAPDVAASADGEFVVVWQGSGDGSGSSIFGQRFDGSGAALGGAFQVNSYVTGDQASPSVSADAVGRFVVVWRSSGQDGYVARLMGRRFDAAGIGQGGEFPVAAGDLASPAVASDAAGGFVVAWTDYGAWSYIHARQFDGDAVPRGDAFVVNTTTSRDLRRPDVAVDGSGNFVVVWDRSEPGRPFPLDRVEGRRFDPSGAPQGDEFVASSTGFISRDGAVDMHADGSFVVTWWSAAGDDEPFGGFGGVFGQRYDASAAPVGDPFRVNSYTTGGQTQPAIAAADDENFVVLWTSQDQDGSDFGIFGQRYGDLIFRDGFEDLDVARWSAASTGAGNLAVTADAALAGTAAGLQAVVNDTSPLFVRDDMPAAENRYRARFYFDPNGFDPGEANNRFRIRPFIAFDDSGRRVITLVLRRVGGEYAVMARVRLSDGTRADTPFIPITDDEHFIELDWRRASGPGAGDGQLTLLLHDGVVADLPSLDNDLSPVDFVRMGALTIKPGAAGTLYFDQFESRRQDAIGPE